MADPTIFEYAIQDDQGLSSRVSVFEAYDGATTTVDSLIGSWLQLGGLVDPVIDGQIINGRITIPLQSSGSWKTAPVEGNNVNQVMVLNMENDFNRYLTEVLLPSYKESQLTASGVPNLAATALAALIAYLIAGDVDIFPNSRDLHDLDAIRDAFLTVRKVRNQKQRTRVAG